MTGSSRKNKKQPQMTWRGFQGDNRNESTGLRTKGCWLAKMKPDPASGRILYAKKRQGRQQELIKEGVTMKKEVAYQISS